MPYDSPSNDALACFYRSAAFVSAIIFSAIYSVPVSAAIESPNYFYDAPSKTWIPTRDAVITPKGTVINNSAANQAQRILDSNGGFTNKSKITANFPAVQKSVPITINARVSPTAVKSAAKNALKGGVAGIVLGAGLDALLGGLDWVMGEGGQIQRPDSVMPSFDYPIGATDRASGVTDETSWSIDSADSVRVYTQTYLNGGTVDWFCRLNLVPGSSEKPLIGVSQNACFYGNAEPLVDTTYAPVPDSDIESAVDSNYSPTLDDYPALAPYLPPESTYVDPIPSVNVPSSTTTVTDLDSGVTTTTETNIWHDFDITDNPSTKPKIDVKTTEETNTYKDGQLTSTSTKTETSPADTDQPSAGSAAPQPESPIDCDLFPTACAWMKWTQEPPEEPEDNLSELLQEVPIVSETFTITGGAATCPAPLVLNLSQFGSREVSYQPLCDLASTMKYLYLALMSFAAAVLLNRSINRV